jgi:hypothetical protein
MTIPHCLRNRETMAPIKPYTAVGLIPTVRGIRKRADIRVNLEHLKHLVKAAAWLSSLDLPVRLIAIPEGAPLQEASAKVGITGSRARWLRFSSSRMSKELVQRQRFGHNSNSRACSTVADVSYRPDPANLLGLGNTKEKQ